MRTILFLVFFGAVILNSGCFGLYTIEGSSMAPELKDGDIVLTTSNVEEIKRGDIILFYDPIKPDYVDIARVVGLPNETVEVREGSTYINGQYLSEPYVRPENNQKNPSPGGYTSQENTFFILGDNRDKSKDSRSYGAIPRDHILRKYVRTFLSLGSDN